MKEGKVKRWKPKNTQERTVPKVLRICELKEDHIQYRKAWSFVINRPDPTKSVKRGKG